MSVQMILYDIYTNYSSAGNMLQKKKRKLIRNDLPNWTFYD